MSRFAKVYQIEDDQVLVYIEPNAVDDDGEDVTIIHCITDVGPIFVDAKIKLPSTIETPNLMKIFDDFDEESAKTFYQKMWQMATLADAINEKDDLPN